MITPILLVIFTSTLLIVTGLKKQPGIGIITAVVTIIATLILNIINFLPLVLMHREIGLKQ